MDYKKLLLSIRVAPSHRLNMITSLDDFDEAGGWDRIDRAVPPDRRVRSRIGITGTPIADILQDAKLWVTVHFATLVLKCLPETEPEAILKYITKRALEYARDAARSSRNGFHSQKGVPVRHEVESDHISENGDPYFDQILPATKPLEYTNSASGLNCPMLELFGQDIFVERPDVFPYWIMWRDNPEIKGHSEQRKEILRLLDIWLLQKRRVRASGKAGFMSLPTFQPWIKSRLSIPADAIRVGLCKNTRSFVWTTPELLLGPMIATRSMVVFVDLVFGDDGYVDVTPEIIKEGQSLPVPSFMLGPTQFLF